MVFPSKRTRCHCNNTRNVKQKLKREDGIPGPRQPDSHCPLQCSPRWRCCCVQRGCPAARLYTPGTSSTYRAKVKQSQNGLDRSPGFSIQNENIIYVAFKHVFQWVQYVSINMHIRSLFCSNHFSNVSGHEPWTEIWTLRKTVAPTFMKAAKLGL